MDISEVSRRSGVAASTLRFYEEKGLITSTGRRGLRRQYGETVLERLSLIALGRLGGFSLDDIAEMLGQGKDFALDRRLLLDKAEELEQSIQQLMAVRDELRHAAACGAANHLECPKFRQLMKMATSKVKATPQTRFLTTKALPVFPR